MMQSAVCMRAPSLCVAAWADLETELRSEDLTREINVNGWPKSCVIPNDRNGKEIKRSLSWLLWKKTTQQSPYWENILRNYIQRISTGKRTISIGGLRRLYSINPAIVLGPLRVTRSSIQFPRNRASIPDTLIKVKVTHCNGAPPEVDIVE